MRTVYCNDEETGNRLLVAKSEDALHADLVVLKVSQDMMADDLLDIYKVVSDNGSRCWVFTEGTQEFHKKVIHLFSATSANFATDFAGIEKLLEDDIYGYTEFSVEKFVIGTAKLRGVEHRSLSYLVHTVEKSLKQYSVYPVVMAVLAALESGETNFTKFSNNMQYFLEVFNKARNADEIYSKTKSHCLSVLSVAGKHPIKDWEKFERFTLSVLLRPYSVEETLDDRINTVVRTIKGTR